MNFLKNFWKNHIQGEFPADYHDECFMCNKGECGGCKYNVVLREGGYLWNQFGDIIGTYDEPEDIDAKTIGVAV